MFPNPCVEAVMESSVPIILACATFDYLIIWLMEDLFFLNSNSPKYLITELQSSGVSARREGN